MLVRIKWIAGAANDSTNNQGINDLNKAEDKQNLDVYFNKTTRTISIGDIDLA